MASTRDQYPNPPRRIGFDVGVKPVGDFIHGNRFIFAGHLQMINRLGRYQVVDLLPGLLTDQDAVRTFLGHLLQSVGNVDRIADDGIFHIIAGSHVTHYHFTGVDAHADLDILPEALTVFFG